MPPNPMVYGAQVADLLREQGRIRGNRELTRGATLASAFQAVPQALSGFLQAREARRLATQAEADRTADRRWQDQTRERTMADWGRENAVRDIARLVPPGAGGRPDYDRIASEVSLIDPLAAQPYRQIAESDLAKARRDAQERAETIAKELGPTKDQGTWDAAVNRLAKKGINGVPRVFGIATRDAAVAEALSFGQWLQQTQAALEPKKTREIKVANPDGTETIQVVEDVPGQTFTSTPAKKDAPKPGTLEFEMVTEATRLGVPVETLSRSQRNRIKADWEAAGRAPKEDKAADDPELPRGVVDYIGSLRRKQNPQGLPYAYGDAQLDLASTWDALRKDHPRLDVVKADDALRKLFRPPPGSGQDSFIDVLNALAEGQGGVRAPAAPAAPLGPSAVSATPSTTPRRMAPSTPIVQPATPSTTRTRGADTPSSVPPAVSALLANEPAGRYTLTDDSVWEKAADGTIRRVK